MQFGGIKSRSELKIMNNRRPKAGDGRRTGLAHMIKLEISITGAGQDEMRQLEALLQKVLSAMRPQLTGVEAKIAATPVVDRYESTKKKILAHIQWRNIDTGTCMTPDFWQVDIQDWLNPKDKRDLNSAIESLCDDGLLASGYDRGTYYLTTEGYNQIY
jgi:hypothetical protein